ncbi:hypothetical protein PG984_007550 [Apiospora sp. TS-2023a]
MVFAARVKHSKLCTDARALIPAAAEKVYTRLLRSLGELLERGFSDAACRAYEDGNEPRRESGAYLCIGCTDRLKGYHYCGGLELA